MDGNIKRLHPPPQFLLSVEIISKVIFVCVCVCVCECVGGGGGGRSYYDDDFWTSQLIEE